MAEGRSKQAFKTWLGERPQAWRDGVEVVAMDGFTGFKTAALVSATHDFGMDDGQPLDPFRELPWLLLAVAAGTFYGLIGAWWGRSRALLAGARR